MNKRQISWYIDSNGRKLAGVEDTGTGWGIVDSEGECLVVTTGYSKESRTVMGEFYDWYLETIKRDKDG